MKESFDVDALEAQIRDCFGQGKFEQAATLARQAIKIAPKCARLYTSLGAILHRTGQLVEAASTLKQAIDLDPGSAIAHDNLGLVLRLLGDIDGSLKHRQKALESIDGFVAEATEDFFVERIFLFLF